MAYNQTAKKSEENSASFTVLKQKVKEKSTSGIFVFYGEEEYTKRYYFSQLAESAGEDGFNLRTFYEKELRAEDLFAFLDTVPSGDSGDMFSDEKEVDLDPKSRTRRVIKLVNPDFGSFAAAEEKALLSRLETISDSITVVFYFYNVGEDNAKLLAKGIIKKICGLALVVEFKHEAVGSAVLLKWVARHFHEHSIAINAEVTSYLCTCIGNDMSTLQHEIEKLIAYVNYKGASFVSKDDIDEICIKSTEVQIFDISNQAMSGNFEKAMVAFQLLRSRKTDCLIIFGTLAKAVGDMCNVDYYLKRGLSYSDISKKTGLKEYPIKKYHTLLADRDRANPRGMRYTEFASHELSKYDERLKSSKTDNYELLEEMIFKLSIGK